MAFGDFRSTVVCPFVFEAVEGWHPGNEQRIEDLGSASHRQKLLCSSASLILS